MLRLDHSTIFTTLKSIVDEAGIKYIPYADHPEDSKYYCVGGKSIKFWDIFPLSGARLDHVLYKANMYLRQFGLMLTTHNYTRTTTQTRPVTILSEGRLVRGKADVEIPKFTLSLLVKPIPESCKL